MRQIKAPQNERREKDGGNKRSKMVENNIQFPL
jgi:hypothetical protein